MMIKYETWIPEHQERMLDVDELDATYERASGESSATFTWNDLGDDVVIVSLGENYSIVSLLTADTWYYLRGSDSDEQADVLMAGQPTTLPRSFVVPRSRGLEVLKRTGNFADLFRTYSWTEQ